MNRRITSAFVLVPALIAILATAVQSQDEDSRRHQESQPIRALRSDLVETIERAFDGAFAEFRGGRTTPELLLELNEDLYAAQLEIADADQIASAKSYLERARKVEALARLNVEHGTGTRHHQLAARAARIRAELEFEKNRTAL